MQLKPLPCTPSTRSPFVCVHHTLSQKTHTHPPTPPRVHACTQQGNTRAPSRAPPTPTLSKSSVACRCRRSVRRPSASCARRGGRRTQGCEVRHCMCVRMRASSGLPHRVAGRSSNTGAPQQQRLVPAPPAAVACDAAPPPPLLPPPHGVGREKTARAAPASRGCGNRWRTARVRGHTHLEDAAKAGERELHLLLRQHGGVHLPRGGGRGGCRRGGEWVTRAEARVP